MQSGSKTEKLSEFYNETLFRIPAMQQAAFHADNGNRTFTYYWTYPCADGKIGACHAVELAYVFNNPEVTIYTDGNYDEDLADAVQDMWVNFARTGDPSTDQYKWERYDPVKRNTMVLGSDIHMESDIKAEQREAIEPILHHYFNGNYMQMSFNVPQTYRIAGMLAVVLAVIIAALLFAGRRWRRRRAVHRQG